MPVDDQFTFERNKTIDAICGCHKQPGMTQSDALVRRGLMKFTGNQHNEKWEWEREKLKSLPTEVLDQLYRSLVKQ